MPPVSLARPASGVTARVSPHSIGSVISPTAWMLTKRRAVDFCHVATAICSPAALTKRRAVDFCHVATAICSPAALP